MRATRLLTPYLKKNYASWSRSYPAFSHSSDDSVIPARVIQLREKLKKNKKEPIGVTSHIFDTSNRGKSVLKEINSNHLNKKYSRGGKNGEGYVGVEEVVKRVSDRFYSKDDSDLLLKSAPKVQDRMRSKVSESYINHAFNVPSIAKKPNPIFKVVMPDVKEIDDLAGEVDPSNQNRYSPMPGLLHKYEMLLAFVSVNCSSHCRYCYRLDLFSGASNKSKADMAVIAAYIKTFNDLIDETIKNHGKWDKKSGLWLHKETSEPLLHVREILFSGGDPMTLPNATLARYMVLMSEAGINTIRIGTKELVFNPSRFDAEFWKTMDLFHQNYPETRLEIVGHYVHPYELVDAKVDREGEYLYDIDSRYQIRKDLIQPLRSIEERSSWIGHYNQFPIISGVNDSPDILRLLMNQSRRLGISMHNIYACREIFGNKHFRGENTIESQYDLVEQSKNGLSGIENHGRLVMSTEYGKVEVCGVEGNSVLLRLNRFIHGNKPDNTIIRVDLSKLPEGQKFYWLTEDIIEKAVSEEGKRILENLRNEGGSLIKHLKKAAAERVLSKLPNNDNVKQVDNTCSQKVIIEVVNRKGGSQTIEVDLSDDKYKGTQPTLATILSQEGLVEAACDEKLSCSTCVVEELESSNPLPEITEDELDLIDSAKRNTPSSALSPRAGCQIPLSKGTYKLTI